MRCHNVNAIKQAIYQYGPVTSFVYADSYWANYKSGVFNRNAAGNANHVVVLVGWDDSKGAWRLRNSYGSGWGENRYMWMKYGVQKVGDGAMCTVLRDPNNSPTNIGPGGYIKCASENQSYALPGKCDVAYGANGKFYYKYGITGTIAFNNATFGDPIAGVRKSGYYKSSNKSGATFFQHCNFGGYRVTLPVGNYNFGDILAQGIKNDDLSSVRVPVGTMPLS